MPCKHPKNNMWYASVWDPIAGKQIRKSSGSAKKIDAIALEDRLRKDMEQRKQSLGAISFSAAAVAYIEQHMPKLKETTRSDYIRYMRLINQRFCSYYVKDITVKEVKNFLAYMRTEQGKSERASTLCIHVLSSFLSFCVETEIIECNPILGRKIKLPASNVRTRCYSEHEKSLLLQHAQGNVRTAIIIALNAGMRKTEIMSIHRSHVDMKNRFILIPETKSGKPRTIPMSRDVTTQITTHGFHPSTGWLFAHEDGTRIKDLKKAFNTLLRRCRIHDANFHDLRRTCGSDLREKGVAMHTISQILGHSSTAVTERVYAHARITELTDAIAVFDKEEKERPTQSLHTGHMNKNEVIEFFKQNPREH